MVPGIFQTAGKGKTGTLRDNSLGWREEEHGTKEEMPLEGTKDWQRNGDVGEGSILKTTEARVS